MKENLKDVELSLESTPCAILFPASIGLGLTSTVLMQLLVEQHNKVVRKFYSRTFPDTKFEDIPFVSCHEIVHPSVLISVDSQDLHLALVANSEYNFGVGEAAGRVKWILHEKALEHQIVEK